MPCREEIHFVEAGDFSVVEAVDFVAGTGQRLNDLWQERGILHLLSRFAAKWCRLYRDYDSRAMRVQDRQSV